MANHDLQSAMTGALLWLEDNQVRDRAGRQSSLRDSAADGEGCAPVIKLNLPQIRGLQVPAPPGMPWQNIPGEWASDVHFYPRRCTFNDLSFVAVQDSNLFSTAFTALPLCLVDDRELPRALAFEALARYALGYDARDGGTGRLVLVEDPQMPAGFRIKGADGRASRK